MANCVSPDSLCHALHNFYFDSAEVDLFNLSQKKERISNKLEFLNDFYLILHFDVDASVW